MRLQPGAAAQQHSMSWLPLPLLQPFRQKLITIHLCWPPDRGAGTSPMLRKAFGAALLGVCGYAVANTVADTLMYTKCKRLVEERAAQHHRLQAVLGEQLAAGPWYDASVQISHSGHIATVTIPLRGNQRSSDVTVRVARKGGFRSTLLYNLTDGQWDVLVMQAVIGGAGGLPQSMSLLQLEDPALLSGTAASKDSCLTRPAPKQQAAAAQPQPTK